MTTYNARPMLATPTLPTIFVTPSTPLYLLPTRSTYKYTSPAPAGPSTRQYTRKEHLLSALELGPSLFPNDLDEKPDHSLLLPPSNDTRPKRPSRRANGLVLSLLVLGLFGLVLVGPMLPYRWYAGTSGAEAPVLLSEGAGGAESPTIAMVGGADAAEVRLTRRWEAYGLRDGQTVGTETTLELDAVVGEEIWSWRTAMEHGLEWALLD